MLNAVNEGKLTENQLAGVLSENTARLYGLYPRKGSCLVGTDADFTIVDMSKEVTLHKDEFYSISKVSAFDNFHVKGFPVQTIVRGRTVMKDGVLTCEQESNGQFIPA